jgi:N6-L-threonylcarbamoyladenine synthase
MKAEMDVRKQLLSRTLRPSLEQWLAVTPQTTLDVLASFQRTVIEELLRRAALTAERIDAKALIVAGGVACNSGLRRAAEKADLPFPVYFPTVGLSTDNAAMIAAAAFVKWERGEFADLSLNAQPNLTLA